VRRWNDPKSPPDAPAAYSFDQGALCVTLGAGDRVLGAWPWPSEGSVSPEAVELADRTGDLGLQVFARRIAQYAGVQRAQATCPGLPSPIVQTFGVPRTNGAAGKKGSAQESEQVVD